MLSRNTTMCVVPSRVAARALSFSSVPKFVLGVMRIPAIIGGGVTAIVVYVQYKVEGTSRGKYGRC
jgi:hypothetical protein